MSTSTYLDSDDDDLTLDEINEEPVDEQEVILTREIATPLSTRRRVEDLLEQKRLERELLQFDFNHELHADSSAEEE